MADFQQRPYSIKMFVPSGDPDGLRIVEKSLWTGIGLVFNRTNLKELVSLPEFARTGVYILVGNAEDDALPTIYIGEGDPVRDRLIDHNKRKDFWNWAVFFVTNDDSLNKAHVQRMECRLLELAKAAKQCKLDNANMPLPPTLSRADAADVDSFVLDMLGIFPLLGLDVFEKTETRRKPSTTFYIDAKGVKASGYEDAKGFVVFKGSQAAKTPGSSLRNASSAMRDDLQEQGVLVPDGQNLVFSQDQVFKSPSRAACVVLGYSTNGRTEWKTEDGRTLKEIQAMATEDTANA